LSRCLHVKYASATADSGSLGERSRDLAKTAVSASTRRPTTT
jgi:hypothetical protein